MQVDLRMLDALPDAFLVVDVKGNIVWCGGAASKVLGTSCDKLVGSSLRSHLAPADWDHLVRLRKRWEAGWDLPGTYRLSFTREGAPPLAADVRFGSFESDGKRLALLSARDLTHQLRAESLIARLSRLPVGGAMLDGETLLAEADPFFVELGWTVAFCEVFPDGSSVVRRVLGPRGDPLADYGRTLLDRKLSPEKAPVVAEVVRTGGPIFLPDLPVHEDGPVSQAQALTASMIRARLTRSAWCPVFTDSKLTHVLAVAGKDVTENDFVALQFFASQLGVAMRMSELRGELVRRERLAAVGQLAAVLAHEVRNPIGVVFNAVAGMRRHAKQDDVLRPYLDIIDEEAERLTRLVRELLEFANPSQPEPAALDVRDVLQQSIEAAALDPACRQPRSRVELVVPEGIPQVLADAGFLRRALVNLIVNALQHVRPGGQVRVLAEASGDEIRITVENDGRPIPPAIAERIFQPFFTTRDAGTGLGLPIVRRLIEDSGGRVALEPRDDGAAFSVWLPSMVVAPPTRIAG